MRFWVARWLGAGALAMSCGLSGAQAPAVIRTQAEGEPADAKTMATVRFQFERAGVPVPRFRLVVRADGTGSYEGDEEQSTARMPLADARPAAPVHIERQISITPATTEKIFKTARAERYFGKTCASKAKNIADTGVKTLSYEGPDGRGACTYNYREDKNVVMLTDLFLGIAETLDEGRKLEFKRRYDRLGLDAELDVLEQANAAGRAVELETIAPLLHQLADDADLMQRVRLRAGKLLDRAAEGK